MKLARVVGTVVSTIKAPIFEGRAMLVVDLLEPDGRPSGGYLLALDTVGAGAGETVLVLDEGTSARQIVGAPFGPLRTVVVGIVDAVDGPAGDSAAAGSAATEGEGAAADSAAAEGERAPARKPSRRRRRTSGG